MDLRRIAESARQDMERYERLGFTTDDTNGYWGDLHEGVPPEGAQAKLFQERTLSDEDRSFVVKFLSYGAPSPGEYHDHDSN